MKTVEPNSDKPHRCPECHRIPDSAHKDGKALSGKAYRCVGCKVRWKVELRQKDLNRLWLALLYSKPQNWLDGAELAYYTTYRMIDMLDLNGVNYRLGWRGTFCPADLKVKADNERRLKAARKTLDIRINIYDRIATVVQRLQRKTLMR